MNTNNQFVSDTHFVVAPHIIHVEGMNHYYIPALKRKNYPQKNIFTIRDFMQQAECEALIAQAQKLGFQQAGLAVGQDIYQVKEKTRNNKRVIFEDKELASLLWERLSPLSDAVFQNHRLWGLNWRFRVYEYPVGGIFAPHVDERMDLGDGKITMFTFMIYLNENLEGGETTFFDRRKSGSKKLNANRIIRPRTGMALAFDHLLFHEGSVVTKGVKYVLRSDIVYQK